jgi:hypothetical protein
MDEKRRKEENKRILDKLKHGENINTVSTEATWYPPRPIIQKDLSKLYPDHQVKQQKKVIFSIVKDDGNG